MKEQMLIGVPLVGVFIVCVIYFSLSGSSETAVSTLDESVAGNGASEMSASMPEVVAVVNGVEITDDAFEAQLAQIAANQGVDATTIDVETRAALQGQIVDSLIGQELLSQAVDGANSEVSESEIETQFQTVMGQFASPDEFNAALEAESLTEASLRERLTGEIATQMYLEEELTLSAITVSEDEIASTYAELAAQQPDAPALEEVRDQVVGLIEQQKQQDLISQHIAELRAEAQVEVLL